MECSNCRLCRLDSGEGAVVVGLEYLDKHRWQTPPQLGFANCLKQPLGVRRVFLNGFPSRLHVRIGQTEEYQLDLFFPKVQPQLAEYGLELVPLMLLPRDVDDIFPNDAVPIVLALVASERPQAITAHKIEISLLLGEMRPQSGPYVYQRDGIVLTERLY